VAKWFGLELTWLVGINLVLWAWVWLVPPVVVRTRRILFGARGMALPGLILLRFGEGESTLRHEMVHLRQMRRYSPLGTALLLGWHYGRGFVRYRRVDVPTLWRLWSQNPLELEALRDMPLTNPLPKVWGWRG
jgi:hypothetical protein